MFLLKLPLLIGFLIAILTSVAFTSILFVVVHRFLQGRRSNITTAFAQQMAIRIGTLHALIIALVFGVIATEYMDLEKSVDIEAASIASLYIALSSINTDVTEKIRNQLVIYLQDLINNEWEHVTKRPLSESTGQHLFKILRSLRNWQVSQPYEEKIKNSAIDLVFEINETRILRLYAWHREEIPMIFWLIAMTGFVLTLVPFLTVELTETRLLLTNCYACMIGITFYGIFLLNNPFMSGLVAPTPYTIIYEEMQSDLLSE